MATRDIERLLEQGGDAPVYGPNLRASCRRLENAGWLRTLRAPNLQLAVELTDAGRQQAVPLLTAEREREYARQRNHEIVVLPLAGGADAIRGTGAADRPVSLAEQTYVACRGHFVVRLNGSTCLRLENQAGQVTRLEGDPLQVASWLQACHAHGLDVRVQINDSDPLSGNHETTPAGRHLPTGNGAKP